MIPQYTRPEAPAPGDWPKGAAYDNTSDTAPLAAELNWQFFFTDQKLQKVIDFALENNRDLRLAALNVERTKAIYGIQRAELLPVITADGIGTKQRKSADLIAAGASRTSKQFSADLGTVAWEIDFFGQLRSLEKQALEIYFASTQARRSAQISLISEVARVYLTLAADIQNLKLAVSTFQTQQDVYNIINFRGLPTW
jgi:multidrug efflux system outer membrane protein